MKEIYTRIQYKLRLYFILTMVCILCDLIGFIIQLVRFAEMAGDERADAMMIGACYVFLVVDFYYACWIKSVNLNLPAKLRESSTAAMMGFGNKFKRQLNIGAIKARDMVKKGGKAAGQGAKKLAGIYKEKRKGKGTLGREIEMQDLPQDQ